MFIDSNMSCKKSFILRWIRSICIASFLCSVGYPSTIASANDVSRPDILFSVDTLSIEQSGISKWVEKKYPFLREWAEGLDEDFKSPLEVYEAMGLNEEDFSFFSFRLDGLDSLNEANSTGPISLSQIFLEMNLWAEKPMNLESFINWLENELASEFRSKKAVESILVDRWMNDTQLRFAVDLQKLDSISGGNSQDSVSLDSNFSVLINLEANKTRIRGFLKNQIDRELMKLENFEQVSLLSQLEPDRQVSFYLKLPEFITSNYLTGGQAENPFATVIEGIEEIAWGSSFRDHSVSFQLLIGCKENAVASALGSLLQGSLGMAQLGLMEDAEARVLLDLIRKIKIEPDAKAVRVSTEVTSEELGQVISGQLASLAPAPSLSLHASGPKAMRGKDAPDILLSTVSDGEFSLLSHRGKVVVLDFWASWCRPCRTALPILLEVSTRYPESEFCLMTVNQEETQEEISDFLTRYDLENLPVAMDLDGKISKQYQVQGIPQTVIINQEGKVEKVWVGFSPFLENDLVAEIDDLLAR